jgi:hypothetical protein
VHVSLSIALEVRPTSCSWHQVAGRRTSSNELAWERGHREFRHSEGFLAAFLGVLGSQQLLVDLATPVLSIDSTNRTPTGTAQREIAWCAR